MVRTPVKKTGWYESDVDAIESALADLGGGNFFKCAEGKNVVRILPPYNDSGKFFIETKLHYGFKQDGKNIAVPYDPNSIISQRLNALASEGEEGAKLARRYGVRTKYYVNVIDRATGAVKIWGFSKKIMDTLKKFYFDEEDGARFDDPEEGRDVIIERTGKGMDTRYDVRFRPKATPAIEADEEIPELFDLEAETTKEFTKEELKAIWNETMEGEGPAKAEDDDDISNDPEPRSTKKKAAFIEDEDDDEEDEKPVAVKKTKAKVEEDDEEEEKPVAKKRVRR